MESRCYIFQSVGEREREDIPNGERSSYLADRRGTFSFVNNSFTTSHHSIIPKAFCITTKDQWKFNKNEREQHIKK